MGTGKKNDKPIGHQFAMGWLEDGMAGALKVAAETKTSKLLNSFVTVREADEDDESSLAFLHSALCSMSLPIRCPTDELAPIIRDDGKYAMAISPKPTLQMVNGKPQMVNLGVPWGVYPRVMLIFMMTEAVRNQSRDVYLGDNFTCFARRLGYTNLSYGPRGTATRMKEQADRLLACEWQIRWDEKFDGTGDFAFREVKLASEYAGSMKEGAFNREIRLSEIFFSNLIEHAVPLNEAAIAQLKSKPSALDLFQYLAYRLPRVTNPKGQVISFEQLARHLGNDMTPKNFKTFIRKTLDDVTAVYPNANVDMSGHVVKLHQSPSPGEKKLFGSHLRLVGSSSSASGKSSADKSSVGKPALGKMGEGAPTALVAVRGFPEGSLHYGERNKRFLQAGRVHGGGYDVDKMADEYRRAYGVSMQNRLEADVMKSWEGFCSSYAARRGPIA